MKKLLLFLVALLPMMASAYDVELDGIYYDLTEDGAIVTNRSNYVYNSYSDAVVIPPSINYGGVTYPVTAIGDKAFNSCENLTSVDIPNTVTSIGNNAFKNCRSLTSINIPGSVKHIGQYAFQESGLTSITFPEGLESIGEFAFHRCSDLTSVNISSSVTDIALYAFPFCPSLVSITVDEGNPIYDSRNNCNAIIETEGNTVVVGCKNSIIPNGVTGIGTEAFYGCDIADITLPNSLTHIAIYAFDECKALTSITIPASVTSIANTPFWACDALASIKVDEGNPVFDSRNDCNAIIETATNTLKVGCKGTVIPSSVTSIGYMAFADCFKLLSINISEGVTSIGENAFQECFGMTSVAIPSTVTEIGDYAFAYCSSLTDVYCFAEDIPAAGTTIFEDLDFEAATLYVPAASVEQYQTTEPWSSFGTIVGLTQDEIDAVEEVEAAETATETARYDLQGRPISTPQNQRPTNGKGINIIRHADGTIKKVLIK